MTTKKADCVFAVFINFTKQLILMFELRHGGSWTFPGGDVRPNESEQDAVRRHAADVLDPGIVIDVIEQLGPLHALPNGTTAKAFVCDMSGTPVVRDGYELFAQCALFDSMALDCDVTIDDPVILRIAWDGITITIPTQSGQKLVDFSFEGYFCDPSRPHILVHEGESQRREWLRLDPSQPGGFMPPPS